MSDIECCFVRFYIVFVDWTDWITLDEINRNRWTGDLIRTWRGLFFYSPEMDWKKERKSLENRVAI